MTRLSAVAAVSVALATAGAWAATSWADPPANGASATVWRTVTEHARYHGHGGEYWANQNTHARRALNRANLRLRRARLTIRRQALDTRRRWAPTVSYAIGLASAVYGVPAAKMWAVASCESTLDPFASNGRYKGLFQLGWSPFGLSPYDPVASALSAAQTVVRDGSWRQWSCG